MIDLGLKRISALLQNQGRFPWQAIHVAGTNGKGSVCAYISSVLNAAGIPCGRFTSPHLVDRWDCITLNGTAVSKSVFLEVEAAVKERDASLGIGATEFELLTATAFEIFSRQKVDIAVVEVGIGGRLDATNVFEAPLATVITKIALDHQGFLGSTLEEIAKEKGGIMKKGTACVVDGSNTGQVLSVLQRIASEVGAGAYTISKLDASGDGYAEIMTPAFGTQRFTSFLQGNYQPSNLACAVNALSHAAEKFPIITSAALQAGIKSTTWPGRMEWVDISSVVGKRTSVLVDGAHNPEAADALAEYVNKKLPGPVTWVLSASKGKEVRIMLQRLLRDGDHVVAVAFGAVDGMPWVSPVDPQEIVNEAVYALGSGESVTNFGHDISAALKTACNGGNVVVAGSLYLAGEVHKLTRLN
ncbi:FolC bifunctional protein [Morchella conica CCBAS932]|uniref:Dihydrofolate synthetase n=1 Tax=Morchella conica CCBAS932 TaxID=1392247 RepID=A0A3N4KC53_9PEZI|nr:FolC bifunctional protein [Morchella conica CCBAS932]